MAAHPDRMDRDLHDGSAVSPWFYRHQQRGEGSAQIVASLIEAQCDRRPGRRATPSSSTCSSIRLIAGGGDTVEIGDVEDTEAADLDEVLDQVRGLDRPRIFAARPSNLDHIVGDQAVAAPARARGRLSLPPRRGRSIKTPTPFASTEPVDAGAGRWESSR